MIVLGVETSCDDTSAAVFDGKTVLSNVISTQLVHQQFGGVVPELASRAHIQLVLPVIEQALSEAKILKSNLQGIAVTYGPGLVGSLLVGLSVVKGLSLSLGIPFVGVNHLEGHIRANSIEDSDLHPPFSVLIVSGGHTQTVFVKAWGDYEVMGRTRDDAAGEAFDKVAKLLNVGYPGGPVIEKLSKRGDPGYIRFPRAFLKEGSLDFSFSGLKTAVLNHVRNHDPDHVKSHLPDIARCFQDAVVDVLVQKAIASAKAVEVSRICLAGGVAVNNSLREKMAQTGKKNGCQVTWPSPAYCTDNGAMIAAAGYAYLEKNITSSQTLSPMPSINL